MQKVALYGIIAAVVVVAGSIAAVVAFELASTTTTSASSSSSSSSSLSTAEEKEKENLVVSIARDPGSPLNIYVTSDGAFDPLVGLVYDKLFVPSPYVDEPQPWLAQSVTQVDHSTWIVKLRPDVKWHDGEPFTAQDVQFTFEYYRDGSPNRHTHHVSQAPRIDNITAEDDQTVRFECGYPCPTLDMITLADLPILPKHVWEGVTEPHTNTNDMPVGTGPYKLIQYIPGEHLRFVANEEYFAGAPLVKELTVPIIKDPSTTFIALRTGEIDAAARPVPPELTSEFQNSGNIDLIKTAPLSLVEIRMNFEKEPFDNPDFRNALSLAIDREELVEVILLGQGRPGTQGYPHPDSPWTNPNLSTPFNQEESAAILDSLSYVDRNRDGVREMPNGTPLQYTIKVAGSEPTWVRAAELVAKQLSEIGISIEVVILDEGAVAKLFSSRDFDLYINNINPHGVADPDQFVMSHRSGYLWKAGLEYPEWDVLFEEYKTTTSVDSRRQVLFTMQELFNEQPTAIVLWYPEENWAYRLDAYDSWQESRGYGIFHKWSLLPEEARESKVVAGP